MLNKFKLEKSEDDMEQKQVAGNDSTQIQVGNLIINQGIDEKRAREVFSEMIPKALADYTEEAFETANARIRELEKLVIPKIMNIDGAINAFKDPAFQILLKKAQQSAAAAENDRDYSLLAELLVCHIQKGDNRKNRTGISKAVEIVDYIDNDALCALTIMHAMLSYIPISGNVKQGLCVLNDMFSRLLYMDLPSGSDWIEHLDILDTIRINQIGSFKKFVQYCVDKLNGYACIGIKVGSDDYNKAIDILSASGIDSSIFVDNIYLDGYVRLPVANIDSFSDLIAIGSIPKRDLLPKKVHAFEEICKLYSNDVSLREKVLNGFISQWDSFDSLKIIHAWWDKIPTYFHITEVGRVLAHTNAKRCDPNIPDLL